MSSLRPTQAIVDLEAIASNIRSIRERVGPAVKIMAVVKANGYGHGAVATAKTVLRNGATWLGVALPDEGIELREAGIGAPILVLGPTLPEEAERVVSFNLDQMVCTYELAEALSRAAQKSNREARVHLKIDTGMGRVGILPEMTLEFALKLKSLSNLKLVGLMTHFACAEDRDKGYSLEQWKRFKRVVETLEEAGIKVSLKHTANSAAILNLPQSYFDMVRPGIMIYGLYPSGELSHSLPLKPAMTLKSRIAFLKTVPKGESIGYSRTYITSRETRVATLPIGYADGLNRLLSNSGEVLLHGIRVPIIGLISMDMVMVDVTEVPQAQVGDEVVIFGRQKGGEISVYEVASRLGTINYEILCNIGRRVPRVYLK